jgi:hypothetical protein
VIGKRAGLLSGLQRPVISEYKKGSEQFVETYSEMGPSDLTGKGGEFDLDIQSAYITILSILELSGGISTQKLDEIATGKAIDHTLHMRSWCSQSRCTQSHLLEI